MKLVVAACLWYLAGYAVWAHAQRGLRKSGVLKRQDEAEFFLFMLFFWPIAAVMYALLFVTSAIGAVVRFFREEW